MTDAVFLAGGQLGEGAGEAVGDKDRIVAETAGAPRRVRNGATHFAIGGADEAIGRRDSDDTTFGKRPRPSPAR